MELNHWRYHAACSWFIQVYHPCPSMSYQEDQVNTVRIWLRIPPALLSPNIHLQQLQDGHKPAVHIFSWSRIPNGFLTNFQIQFALYLVTCPWLIYIIYSSRSYYLLFIEWGFRRHYVGIHWQPILCNPSTETFEVLGFEQDLVWMRGMASTNPYKIWPTMLEFLRIWPFICQLILPIIALSLHHLPWTLHYKNLWC